MALFGNKKIIAAGLISSSAFFLLAGYELVRSSANSLFKSFYGTSLLPVAMATTPVVLLLVLWLYNKCLTFFGPRKTLFISTIFSGLVIFFCYLGISLEVKASIFFLFVFRECYVVLLIEQYWSFLNSTLSQKEAKNLNGPIAGWSSVGAILGAFVVSFLAQKIGSAALLLFSVVLVIPGAFCSDFDWAERSC